MTTLARRIIRQLRRDERGAIGVLVAVLLAGGVLTGMGALVIDVGQLYQVRAEQQSGADAGALGVAKSCVLGLCDPNIAAGLADANASRLTGNKTGVSLVCGSGVGLPSCPAGSGAPTDCPAPTEPSFVDVYTSTDTASGSTLLPPVFARSLLGNSSYQGSNVVACSQAAWGAPSSAQAVALTMSACEWDQATQQGSSFAPPPTYPPDPLPAPSFDESLTLGQGTGGGGCASEPGGAAGPGTFSALAHPAGNCTTLISPLTFQGRSPANYVSPSCQQLLQDAQNNNTPLLVPIYTSAAAGSPPSYTLKGFAEFVVTGYNLPTIYASDWLDPANNCTGNNYCLNGYFVRGVIPSTGSLNGTNLGASVIELTG